MDAQRIVSRDRGVMGGELVFAGTRVPVRSLVDYLKAGQTTEAFLAEFPMVDREQAEGYLELAAEAAANIEVTAEKPVSAGGSSQGTHMLLEDLTSEELASMSGRQDITPSDKGSGLSDVSRDHNRYLAGG